MSKDKRLSRRQKIPKLPAGPEGIKQLLEEVLPPTQMGEASYLTNMLAEAGGRYDRYTAQRTEWLNYNDRTERLKEIKRSADALAAKLSELDILSHDDLAGRFGSQKIEALVGTLGILAKKAGSMKDEVQKIGRPRDIAEERWIMEVADIYEKAFGRPARISGSGAEPAKSRGSFYRLLEVSRPKLFARHGKLSVKQVDRVLKRKKKKTMSLQALREFIVSQTTTDPNRLSEEQLIGLVQEQREKITQLTASIEALRQSEKDIEANGGDLG